MRYQHTQDVLEEIRPVDLLWKAQGRAKKKIHLTSNLDATFEIYLLGGGKVNMLMNCTQ